MMVAPYPLVPWSEVEQRAIPMFDLHHRERGMAWAKQAWRHLEEQEMTTRRRSVTEASTYLRLIALALIHDGYSKAAWNIHKGLSAVEWAAEFRFSRFALGKLNGYHYTEIQGDTDVEACNATIEFIAHDLIWEVCKALVKGYGSVDGLHASLWHIRHDPDDPTTPNAFSDEGPQKRAQAYLEEQLVFKGIEEA
jgi:peptidoglycan/xylan/chitin deacetylase (PgdA/CDA1 family)